jgi:proline dehydrogenase
MSDTVSDLRRSTSAAANEALRRALLWAAHDRTIARAVKRGGLRLGAARFVAGETLDDCIPVLRRLNEEGFVCNTTMLGEGTRDPVDAERVVVGYEEVLKRIADEELRANVALKLTHLGLDIDEELAHGNVSRLVAQAGELDGFIRIDMEESTRVDATLRIYRRLRAAGHENIGMVLQAYLYRSLDDLRELLPLRPNLRLVKGAYLEPPDVAFPRKPDVDRNYVRMIDAALEGGGFTAIATHDERVIERSLAMADRLGLGSGSDYQLQMLYGVRLGLQRDLIARGQEVLIATPFGPEWYAYFMRRLAERPANLGFFLKNLVRR